MLNSIILNIYLFALLVVGIFSLEAAYLIYNYLKRKKVILKNVESGDLPLVTVQLPIYNEIFVAERLIDSVCALDYPKQKLEIQILDDSTDETKEICERLVSKYKLEDFNIDVIYRENREGFKAGALRYGLAKAKGEFIAIFDADFLPEKNFLLNTINYFEDKNIGMVQTRWEHLNEEYSFLTKAQAFGLAGHFIVEQNGRNNSGLFINFNGTAGIWRKICIEDAGNWQADTLTEDLDLSYRAQLKGWKFVFLNDVVTPSELPAEVNALKSQQYRWTKGSVETAIKILPKVWKSKIPLRLKIHSTFHLTNNLVYPFIFILALLNLPLIMIKNTLPESKIYFFIFSFFLISFLISFVFYAISQKMIYKDWIKRLLIFPIFMSGSMGFSINNTKAVIAALMNRKSPFIRTPKYDLTGKQGKINLKMYKPRFDNMVLLEIIMAIYSLVGVGVALYYLEIGIIPFMLMFFFGYSLIAYLSIKHYLIN
jgi:cellulose synthase/poly-beta-1,6-N-acetylglucosamine synthase-like glycosyltransferase